MVGLSAAQGYYQASGKTAAVIVHVDCGTQALAGAVHNVARSRTPVFIYAGASPFTQDGEMRGSRNEFIHWLQDAVDQPAIVRQYMKHVTELRSYHGLGTAVMRSLQIARSDPTGPVYVWCAREVSEQKLDVDPPSVDVATFGPVEPAALTNKTTNTIIASLMSAKNPLIITSRLGESAKAVEHLKNLAEILAVRVLCSFPTAVNIPTSSPNALPVVYLPGPIPALREADVILVIDADVPWIPTQNRPRADAVIYHIDPDPLKEGINAFYIPATIRARANSETALLQLFEAARAALGPDDARIRAGILDRQITIHREYVERQPGLQALRVEPHPTSSPVSLPHFFDCLRMCLPPQTRYLSEAISNFSAVWDHLAPELPGTLLQCGASSLGWALGAAVGVSLAAKEMGEQGAVTCAIVGDGSFMFGVPSAAYWMARRYSTPFICIVLNNEGWKSPGLSLRGVYPDATAPAAQTHTSFAPSVDYGLIAEAAGSAWHQKVRTTAEVLPAIGEALSQVVQGGRCALLEVVLEPI